MDLKVIFLVVCLTTLAITSTDAGIPKCCIKTRDFPPRKLLKVERWEWQSDSGACDIDALVLYIKGQLRPLCAHPKLRNLLKRLFDWKKQNQHKLGRY